jgi:hypothetical protein
MGISCREGWSRSGRLPGIVSLPIRSVNSDAARFHERQPSTDLVRPQSTDELFQKDVEQARGSSDPARGESTAMAFRISGDAVQQGMHA